MLINYLNRYIQNVLIKTMDIYFVSLDFSVVCCGLILAFPFAIVCLSNKVFWVALAICLYCCFASEILLDGTISFSLSTWSSPYNYNWLEYRHKYILVYLWNMYYLHDGCLIKSRNCLPTLREHRSLPRFMLGSVLLIISFLLCCPIMYLYLLSSVFWCPLRFLYKNDALHQNSFKI